VVGSVKVGTVRVCVLVVVVDARVLVVWVFGVVTVLPLHSLLALVNDWIVLAPWLRLATKVEFTPPSPLTAF
jgi:hypothetical protein